MIRSQNIAWYDMIQLPGKLTQVPEIARYHGEIYGNIFDTISTIRDNMRYYLSQFRQYAALCDTMRHYFDNMRQYATLFDTISTICDTMRHYLTLFRQYATLCDTISGTCVNFPESCRVAG